MNYDEVLPHLSRGNFGKYQTKIYIFLCFPIVLCAFHKLAGVFLLAVPDHRCILDDERSNATFELPDEVWNASYPYDELKSEFSKCEYFRSDKNGTKERLSCTDYVWSTEKVDSSVVKSFSLVCDHASLRASADAFLMIGLLLGSYLFGDLSDKYGRRPILMLSLLIQVAFGLLTALSRDFITYTICRMIVGASTSGVFLVAYCLAVEMVGKESRLYAGIFIQMFFSGGYMMIGGISYFISDWRWFQTAITVPGLLFLSYWFFIPESTRWLLGNEKREQAIQQINKVAKANKLVVPQEVLEKLEGEKEAKEERGKKPSLIDLFKTPNLRTKSLLIFFDWFVISGTYYGLSWSTNDLGGNKLLNFVISGFVEFPASFFVLATLNRWGRKKILTGSMVFGGVTLLISLLVPRHINWLIVLLAMLGKMSITASYEIIYVFSAEQFPTVIRSVALGASSMSARMGGITAPYLIFLSQFWKPAPFLIFGIAACIGGISSTFLPETNNMELPETIADGERLGKHSEIKSPDEAVALNAKQ